MHFIVLSIIFLMFPYDFSISDFFIKFKDNSDAVQFLIQRGILKSTSYCLECNKLMNLQQSTRAVDCLVLRCCKCKKQQSIRAKTFLEKSKITARIFLLFLYFWSNNSNIAQLRKYTGLSEPTCIDYSNFLREIASWRFQVDDKKLGGVGHIVQVDESVIYRAKHNRGHALLEPQKWIFGIYDVEEKVGAVFFVEDRSAATLHAKIKEHILPGTEIHSDQWRGYMGITEIEVTPRYIHKTVNHSLWFKDPETEVHTNNVEAYWCSVKKKFKEMLGTSRAMTASYLDIHMYKQRYGQTPEFLFDSIMADIERKYILE